MAGTKRQTSEKVLQKLIKHWPGYSIIGSRPYSKGVRIIWNETKDTIQTFPSNDAAFLTMTESITKNNGWYPGKDITLPLFGDSELVDNVAVKDKVKKAQMVLFNNARKARDLRIEADRLFGFINIDPMDKNWEKKIKKVLTVRRNK
jgi:hypothetical protein